MKFYQKAYWKIRNAIQAPILRILGNPGMLTPRDDPRDRTSMLGFGAGQQPSAAELGESLSLFEHQYTQKDNICTAAAAVLAISEQTGIRWSIKAVMRMMVKQGRVNGNGYSYQRAPLDVIIKHGLIPYELMPDENDKGWRDYSKWDEETERLYKEVAPKYKFTEYKKLLNENAIFAALLKGFVPITASQWFRAMNRPKAPNFLLEFVGGLIGGHQYRITGHRNYGEDIETPQTFGRKYGKDGKAWARTVFGKGFYENYILEYKGERTLPTDVLLPVFLNQNEGLMVRSPENPACYVIVKGTKRHVRGDDDMKTFGSLHKKLGLKYVHGELLDAVPCGPDYPLI